MNKIVGIILALGVLLGSSGCISTLDTERKRYFSFTLGLNCLFISDKETKTGAEIKKDKKEDKKASNPKVSRRPWKRSNLDYAYAWRLSRTNH